MFPGETKQAFRWVCAWVYDVARRGPGKKFFHVDELWQWCADEALPRELALVANTGREEHIELVPAPNIRTSSTKPLRARVRNWCAFAFKGRTPCASSANWGPTRRTSPGQCSGGQNGDILARQDHARWRRAKSVGYDFQGVGEPKQGRQMVWFHVSPSLSYRVVRSQEACPSGLDQPPRKRFRFARRAPQDVGVQENPLHG